MMSVLVSDVKLSVNHKSTDNFAPDILCFFLQFCNGFQVHSNTESQLHKNCKNIFQINFYLSLCINALQFLLIIKKNYLWPRVASSQANNDSQLEPTVGRIPVCGPAILVH